MINYKLYKKIEKKSVRKYAKSKENYKYWGEILLKSH